MTEPQVDQVLTLSKIPEFSELPPDDLASLFDRAQLRSADRGEALLEEPASALCLLLSGSVREDGTSRVHEAPAMLGAVEALTERVLPRYVAAEQTSAAILDRQALAWILAHVFEIWLVLARHVVRRLVADEPTLEAERTHVQRLLPEDQATTIVTRIRLLQACKSLCQIPLYNLARIAKTATELDLETSETLWAQGDVASHAFILIRGSFDRENADGETPFAHEPGSVLGLRHALAELERPSRVCATSDSRVLKLSIDELIDEFEDAPDAAAALLETLARQAAQVLDLGART